MPPFLIALRRNLAAGVRLALMRRVSPLDFRVTVGQFIALAVVGGLCASMVDLSALGGDVRFNVAGIGGHVRDTAILLLLCWIVALMLRAPGAALSLPVVLLSAGWVPDIAFAAIVALESIFGINNPTLTGALWWAILSWSWLVAWRSVATVLQGRGYFAAPARALAVLIVFGGMVGLALLYPAQRLWDSPPALEDDADDEGRPLPRVESEAAMTAQPRVLFEALSTLERRESGTSNTYFVGFAGDASQDVFRNDMEAAQQVVDERLGTTGRSVSLINSRRTLFEAPIATASNLQATLSTVGRLIDADEDVAVIYLSSHGSANHQLYVNFPPLVLQQLTPTSLARMLQESRIKYKVVIVSACFSGGYVAALKDPYTMVMTSSRADRTSFGCDNKSEFTYFGEAFFQDALKQTTSLADAFEIAKRSIAERERAGGLTPSEPQISVGDAIREKLGSRARVGKGAVASANPENRHSRRVSQPSLAARRLDFAPVFMLRGIDDRRARFDRHILVAERNPRDPQ